MTEHDDEPAARRDGLPRDGRTVEEPETTSVAEVGDDPGLVAGRYRILRTLGRGGGGHVWLAEDDKLGRQVALKRVAGEADAEVLVTRGLREARTSATLAHEHVVRVYDAFEFDGAPWIVMEYVPGPSLAALLEGERALPPQQVATIGAQVATALAAAHGAGIVHRDVKPGNVLLTDASGSNAKLTDFGIARAEEDQALTRTGFVAGTAAYFSPELARGEDPSPASDVWALGATLYAAVEGRRPFAEEPNAVAQLHRIVTDQPAPTRRAGALAPVLKGMLDPDPQRRWGAARAADEMRRIASTVSTAPVPVADDATQQVPAAGAAWAGGPDHTRSLPVAGERRPEAWPGQDVTTVARGEGQGGQPAAARAGRGPARRGAARPARRVRPTLWLAWLIAAALLAALGWLVWSIAQGLDGTAGSDRPSTTQATGAEPVGTEEARQLADRFYVVVSRQGPPGVADMLGPGVEVDPEIREGLTRLRYDGMRVTAQDDGSQLVTATVTYTYGADVLRQDEELVVGRAEAGGEPLILRRTTTPVGDDASGTGEDR